MSQLARVLLLGDSIRMSYQPFVAEKLASVAQVVGPEENCQYSLYTLSSLSRWVAQLGQPHVVHWNNGLHDVGHNPFRSPVQIPLDMFVANLRFILEALKTITPRVIWATTTPVHPKRPFRTDVWSWRNEEINRYNEAAVQLMAEYGVPVNELYTVVWNRLEHYLADDQVHLTEAGQQACAEAVAQNVRQYL